MGEPANDSSSVQALSIQPISIQPTSIQPISIQPISIQPSSIQPEDGDMTTYKGDPLSPSRSEPTIATASSSSSSFLIKYYHLGRELHPGVDFFDTPGSYTLLAVFDPAQTRASSNTETRASSGSGAGTRASTGTGTRARASYGTTDRKSTGGGVQSTAGGVEWRGGGDEGCCYQGSTTEVTLVVMPSEAEDRYCLLLTTPLITITITLDN